MLYREWEAYDRQRKECREQQMHDSELKPRQDYPDDVHDQCDRPARWFGCAYLATKWRDDTTSESETHDSKRYADDREAQQDATQNVTKEDKESAKYEEHQIANE